MKAMPECAHHVPLDTDCEECSGASGFDPYKEIRRLRVDCAEAYQVIGAMSDRRLDFGHPDVQRALDNLNAAVNGDPRPHDDLLPFPRGGAGTGTDATEEVTPR